jgi:hypothetical protein
MIYDAPGFRAVAHATLRTHPIEDTEQCLVENADMQRLAKAILVAVDEAERLREKITHIQATIVVQCVNDHPLLRALGISLSVAGGNVVSRTAETADADA